VMPNHIHGILIIDKQDDGRYVHYDRRDVGRDAINRVSTIPGIDCTKYTENQNISFKGTGYLNNLYF